MPTEKKFKEEEEIQGDVVAEDEVTTDEVVAEEETTEEVEVDIEEDVNALFGGEDLSEEFKKGKAVFETALNSKVSEVKEALEANTKKHLKKESLKKKHLFLRELIIILSMLQMSGSPKMLLQLSKG